MARLQNAFHAFRDDAITQVGREFQIQQDKFQGMRPLSLELASGVDRLGSEPGDVFR